MFFKSVTQKSTYSYRICFILPSARNPQNKPTNNPELRHLGLNRLYRQYNFLAASKEGMLPDEFRTYYEKPDTFKSFNSNQKISILSK